MEDRPRELRDLLSRAAVTLAASGIPDPRMEAELLAGHVLGLSRGGVQAQALVGWELSVPDERWYGELVFRRAAREPLQHIIGRTGFRHLELEVGSGVFVPRPETEVVAGLAIDAARNCGVVSPLVTDLCSGSGVIAFAVASEVPAARVWAVEVSPDAHAWALRNCERLGLSNVQLQCADATTALPELDGTVDVVVSNPPYISTGNRPRAPEVQRHDPPISLYGGIDGLDVLRLLSRRAHALLRPGGTVVFEHGEPQSSRVAEILTADGWTAVAHHRDLTDRDRATTAVRAVQAAVA